MRRPSAPEDAGRIRVGLGDQLLTFFGRLQVIVDVPAASRPSGVLAPRPGIEAKPGHRETRPHAASVTGREELAFLDRGSVAAQHNLEPDVVADTCTCP